MTAQLSKVEVAALPIADTGGRKQSRRAVGVLEWRNDVRPEGPPEAYVPWEGAREHTLTKATRKVPL